MADLLVGILVAAAIGMGVGGGGLMVLYLTLFCHLGQIEAQGINLLFFPIASLAAIVLHRDTHKLRWRMLLPIVGTGILAAVIGAFLSSLLSGTLLRKLFGFVLVLSGIVALRKKE